MSASFEQLWLSAAEQLKVAAPEIFYHFVWEARRGDKTRQVKKLKPNFWKNYGGGNVAKTRTRSYSTCKYNDSKLYLNILP